MLKVEKQESHRFDELTSLQYGWDFTVSQLGPNEGQTWARLFQTQRVGINWFHYGAPLDQKLRSRAHCMSFGLLDSNSSPAFTHDQLIPNDAITVFPDDDLIRGNSLPGFAGNGLHINIEFLEELSHSVYGCSVDSLISGMGMYLPDPDCLLRLRNEIGKWRRVERLGRRLRPSIIQRREENLAISVLGALADESVQSDSQLLRSDRALSKALQFIHDSDLENLSAAELCRQSGCSQRLLEKAFLKRFGVTPKKYIKRLRIARVHEDLMRVDTREKSSIIELAGIHGFWHMGQFAADYRAIYGELPSQTLNRG